MQQKSKVENSDVKVMVAKVGRCAKAVKGGRKFTFSVLSIAGDGKGKVGIGLGKAGEVADARDKAEQNAKKNMIRILLRDSRTLHHDIEMKFCSGKVKMRAAPAGTGIIAGGAIRILCEVLGIKDIVVKSIASTNPHNMVKAAVHGLENIRSLRYIAEKRGKKVGDIVGAREAQAAKS
ncbi:MAG: 30S ribosomal protein S5 [Candidatus Midichloria sp.]|nr:MAG: 30S ribosomal protein S5 [Candidatus Midichloria sp.]